METVTTNPIDERQLYHVLMSGCSVATALDWISQDLRLQLEEKLTLNADLYDLPDILTWQERIDTWTIPEKYIEFDIATYVQSLARDAKDSERITWELAEFDRRKLLPVLRTIKYLVDVMREHNVLWGVGRGSSVSSLVLFLLGIHRIDPIKWNLDAGEFFK